MVNKIFNWIWNNIVYYYFATDFKSDETGKVARAGSLGHDFRFCLVYWIRAQIRSRQYLGR